MLDGQAVAVPAEAARDVVARRRGEAGDDVLSFVVVVCFWLFGGVSGVWKE